MNNVSGALARRNEPPLRVPQTPLTFHPLAHRKLSVAAILVNDQDCSSAKKEMLTENVDPDSIGLMKTKTTGLILALCFFGNALCFAVDPQISTSKPNESKSKVTAGTEKIKPTYISLVQFTDKGIQGAKQTTQRVAAWAAKVQSMGVTIKQMYWTLGQYDQVCIFEAGR